MVSSVVQAARELLGTPFRHQGRSTAGVDCAGLVVLAYAAAGLPVKDAKGYSRLPHKRLLETALEQSFERVDEPQPGDVLLMAFEGEPQHLAIYAGRTILHSYQRAGKVIEHRYADVWRARVRGVYRRV